MPNQTYTIASQPFLAWREPHFFDFEGEQIKSGNISYFYDVYHVTSMDKINYTPKKGTKLYRIKNRGEEDTCYLLVCINREKKLLYFLKDYSIGNSDWKTKGVKLDA